MIETHQVWTSSMSRILFHVIFFLNKITKTRDSMGNWPKYFIWCITVSSSLKVWMFESIAWFNWLILHLSVPLFHTSSRYSSCCSTFYPAPSLWKSNRGWTRFLKPEFVSGILKMFLAPGVDLVHGSPSKNSSIQEKQSSTAIKLVKLGFTWEQLQ